MMFSVKDKSSSKFEYKDKIAFISAFISLISLIISGSTLYITQFRSIIDIKAHLLGSFVDPVVTVGAEITSISYNMHFAITNSGTMPVAITSIMLMLRQVRDIRKYSEYCEPTSTPAELMDPVDFTSFVVKPYDVYSRTITFSPLPVRYPVTLDPQMSPSPRSYRLGFCFTVDYLIEGKQVRRTSIPVDEIEIAEGQTIYKQWQSQWLLTPVELQ